MGFVWALGSRRRKTRLCRSTSGAANLCAAANKLAGIVAGGDFAGRRVCARQVASAFAAFHFAGGCAVAIEVAASAWAIEDALCAFAAMQIAAGFAFAAAEDFAVSADAIAVGVCDAFVDSATGEQNEDAERQDEDNEVCCRFHAGPFFANVLF